MQITNQPPVYHLPTESAANIVARREYGRSGHCRTCHMDSVAQNGSSSTWEAFIGRPGADGSTTGRNIRLYV